jgi:hypothetical protein
MPGAGDCFDQEPRTGEIKMTTERNSAHHAGLLPVPIRPTTLKNDRFPKGKPSRRKRVSWALSSLIAFWTGVVGTFAWWSYDDATRQMIANWYPQLGWLAPRHAATVQKAPDMIAPAGLAAPHPDATLGDDLHAIRLNLDRIVAGQELITRSVDEIATRIAAEQEWMRRSIGQTATMQEPTARSIDQTAAIITTGQGQMTSNTDQTTTSVDPARSATISSIAVESRGDAVSLQPALRADIKPSEVGLAQTLSERGKPSSPESGHDASCFPSASAVLQNHPGASPTWTMRAPGHEGTLCWRVAARPNGSDHRPSASAHRRELMPKEPEADGAKENTLFPPPYMLPPE